MISKVQPPKPITIKDALRIIGDSKTYLKDLDDYIQTNYKTPGEFKFSKKSGWSIFYRKSGKSLAIIDLKDKGLNVTVVIGASLNDTIRHSDVSIKIKNLFRNAHQYHDGRWLHIPVENGKDIEDIKLLLLMKKKPIK